MKDQDRSDRFVTPFSKMLIIRDGKAFRADGKPLTQANLDRLAGRDPLADQLKEVRSNDAEK